MIPTRAHHLEWRVAKFENPKHHKMLQDGVIGFASCLSPSHAAPRLSGEKTSNHRQNGHTFKFPNSCFVIISLLLFLTWLPATQSHADNLVHTAAGCKKELSTKSRIMKKKVLSPEESTHPNIRLKLARGGDPKEMVLIDVERSTPIVYWIKLHVPYVNLGDIEYVMEVNSTSPENAASFPEVGACANQKRAPGKSHKHDLGVFFRIDSWPDDQGEFHIWAGWSTGHEAVRLTPPLIFRRTTHDEEKEEF